MQAKIFDTNWAGLIDAITYCGCAQQMEEATRMLPWLVNLLGRLWMRKSDLKDREGDTALSNYADLFWSGSGSWHWPDATPLFSTTTKTTPEADLISCTHAHTHASLRHRTCRLCSKFRYEIQVDGPSSQIERQDCWVLILISISGSHQLALALVLLFLVESLGPSQIGFSRTLSPGGWQW